VFPKWHFLVFKHDTNNSLAGYLELVSRKVEIHRNSALVVPFSRGFDDFLQGASENNCQDGLILQVDNDDLQSIDWSYYSSASTVFDVYILIRGGEQDSISLVKEWVPKGQVIDVPSHGGDMFAFMQIVSSGHFRGYRYLCLLKAPDKGSLKDWELEVRAAFLNDNGGFQANIIDLLDTRFGLVGSLIDSLDGSAHYQGDEYNLRETCAEFGLHGSLIDNYPVFFNQANLIIRGELLNAFVGLKVGANRWPDPADPIKVDMSRVVRQMLSLKCISEGLLVARSSSADEESSHSKKREYAVSGGVKYSSIRDCENASSLCVFAAYDTHSTVQEYVFHLISELQRELDAHVVYVTTSEILSERDQNRLHELDVSIIHRENIGYDFMSYFVGLEFFKSKLMGFEYIYHANDSVYGPFSSLREIATRMNSVGHDVWGLTDSWDLSYHIQSYFVCFAASAYPSLFRFWEEFTFPEAYQDVVWDGEVGITQHMMRSGMSVGVAFPTEEHSTAYLSAEKPNKDIMAEGVNASAGRSMNYELYTKWTRAVTLNPCAFLWQPLMRAGYPFLKKKLLTQWDSYDLHSGEWLNEIDPEYGKAKNLTISSVNSTRGMAGLLKHK
jgi:hypothetical protein